MISQLRLQQLLSPVLPIGAYSYSQGLEWAVKQQWLDSRIDLDVWLGELIEGPLTHQDLPLLRKLYRACINKKVDKFNYWSHVVVAFRDTAETRDEERARANAYLRILDALPLDIDESYQIGMRQSPLAAIAWASANWEVEQLSLLHAYAYNWLDAYIVNGVKLIPLGQSDGQALLHAKLPFLSKAVTDSLEVSDDNIGFSVPAVAMASSSHEVQYSRIYRS